MSYTEQKKKNLKTSDGSSAQSAAYGGYVKSDAVRQAEQNLGSLQKPGAFQSQWNNTLNDTMNKILNREKFSYDLNGDALYQQYKNQYTTQGQQAMMDTMGQAAALTGGYGNSYAQSVGQQTYQGYLQQLNDKVPELYQLALDQYNREGEDLYNQYGLLADREATDYDRYRDTMSDYLTERDYLTGRLDSEKSFDYGQYRDTVADKQWQTEYDRGVLEADRAYDYQVGRDAVADSQWQQEFDTKNSQWQAEFDASNEHWQAEFDETVRNADREYELTVRQIEEDIRHNKITEDQGQQQINLAKAELEQRKTEAANDYAYKMASLDAKGNKDDYGFSPETEDENGDGDITIDDVLGGIIRKNDKSSVSDQNKMRSAVLKEISAALKAGEITSAEAEKLKKKYAPTGSTGSGGRYAY